MAAGASKGGAAGGRRRLPLALAARAGVAAGTLSSEGRKRKRRRKREMMIPRMLDPRQVDNAPLQGNWASLGRPCQKRSLAFR